jgi:hypothetical protein
MKDKRCLYAYITQQTYKIAVMKKEDIRKAAISHKSTCTLAEILCQIRKTEITRNLAQETI